MQNNGDNPDVPLVKLTDHHEAIISREVWDLAQKQVFERGEMSREGRKYSRHYWFSSKVFCGKCGYTYNITGKNKKIKRSLRCVNRSKYGANPRIDANGAEVGCDNHAINERVLEICMKHILEYIQFTRGDITGRLLENISEMQSLEPTFDAEPLKAEIDTLNKKKRKAIDLMLDELITKEELKQQTAYYDEEISKITETIAARQMLPMYTRSSLTLSGIISH